jgi:hypothetical protein
LNGLLRAKSVYHRSEMQHASHEGDLIFIRQTRFDAFGMP